MGPRFGTSASLSKDTNLSGCREIADRANYRGEPPDSRSLSMSLNRIFDENVSNV
jgi:hypothetical protein